MGNFDLKGLKGILVSIAAAVALVLSVLNAVIGALPETLGTTNFDTLNVETGSAAAPSLSFTDDPDSGLYRVAANDVGISAGGSKIVDVTASGMTVVGSITASSIVTDGNAVLQSVTATNVTSTLSSLGIAIGTSFSGTNLTGTVSSLGTATGTSFSGTNLTGTVSSLGTATATSFSGTNLTGTVSSLGTAAATSLAATNITTTDVLLLSGSPIREIAGGTATIAAEPDSTVIAHGMAVAPDFCEVTAIGAGITRTFAYTTTATTNIWVIPTAGAAGDVAWACFDK